MFRKHRCHLCRCFAQDLVTDRHLVLLVPPPFSHLRPVRREALPGILYIGGEGYGPNAFYSISIWLHDHHDTDADDYDHERTRHNGGEEGDEHAEEHM